MPLRPKPDHSSKPPRKAWDHGTTADQRGYTWAWRKPGGISEQVKREEPLCRMCLAEGILTPTAITDHIIPKAEGGTDERSNLQGLCKAHSDAKTAEERRRACERR